MSTESPSKRERPLSPHLQIYAPQITSVTSILHRFTGVVNSVGLLVLVVFLYAVAFDVGLYIDITRFFGTIWGALILVGFASGLCYHVCAGVRHFLFDLGYMMSLKEAKEAGYTVLIMSALMTLVLAYVIWQKVLCYV